MKKRIFTGMICAAVIISMMPVTALAFTGEYERVQDAVSTSVLQNGFGETVLTAFEKTPVRANRVDTITVTAAYGKEMMTQVFAAESDVLYFTVKNNRCSLPAEKNRFVIEPNAFKYKDRLMDTVDYFTFESSDGVSLSIAAKEYFRYTEDGAKTFTVTVWKDGNVPCYEINIEDKSSLGVEIPVTLMMDLEENLEKTRTAKYKDPVMLSNSSMVVDTDSEKVTYYTHADREWVYTSDEKLETKTDLAGWYGENLVLNYLQTKDGEMEDKQLPAWFDERVFVENKLAFVEGGLMLDQMPLTQEQFDSVEDTITDELLEGIDGLGETWTTKDLTELLKQNDISVEMWNEAEMSAAQKGFICVKAVMENKIYAGVTMIHLGENKNESMTQEEKQQAELILTRQQNAEKGLQGWLGKDMDSFYVQINLLEAPADL